MNILKRFSVLAVTAALSGRTFGQQPAPAVPATPPAAAPAEAAAQSPVKDYGSGFKALYRLGFPDVAKAEYVKLQAYSSRSSGSFDTYLFENEIKMAGNAWMLEETPKKKGLFVMNVGQVQEVYDSQALNKERMEEMQAQAKTNKTPGVFSGFSAAQDDRCQGTWKKADAAKDAQKLLDYLRKAAKAGSDESSGRFNSFRFSNAAGQSFLIAAQFYRKGLTNEANQIVAVLFESAGDPKKVLTEAINTLADLKLQAINQDFFKSRNWTAYATNLDAAVATFGKVWKQGPVAKRLADKVRQRAAVAEPPAPAGEGLTDEDRALAKELARMENSQSYGSLRYGLGPWILPGQTAMHRRMHMGMPGGGQGGQKDALQSLMQRGLKSVPLLLALAKDDYLVAVDQAGGGYSSRSFGDTAELNETQLDQMYRDMSRPVTRGEIAVALLKPLLPSKDEHSSSGDAFSDDVIDECAGWYKQNKEKTPVELARIYLNEGNTTQSGAAIRYLAKKGAADDIQAIEKHLIEVENPQEVIAIVTEYVTLRGDKAKDFVAKFEAHVTAPPAAGAEDPMFKQARNDPYMKQQLASLKALTETHSFTNLLESVASGAKTMTEISGPFYQQMGKAEPESALADILTTVLKATDPRTAVELLGLAQQLKHAGARGMMMGMGMEEEPGEGETPEEPPEGKTPPAVTLKIAKSADLWRKLLSDKRVVAPGQTATIADSAASTMDAIYAEQGASPMEAMARMGMGGMPDARYVMGDKARDVYRARAEALLAGKNGADLPPFPKLEPLKDEQKKALADRLLKAAAGDLAKAVEALTLDERVAVPGLTKTNEALNAKLAPLALVVKEVSVTPADSAWAGSIAGLKGKALNKAAVEQLLEGARKALEQGKVVTLAATRRGRMGGIAIVAQEIAPGSREYKEMATAKRIGTAGAPEITGGIAAPGCAATATWVSGAPAAKEAAVAPASADDATLAAAVKEVETELAAAVVKDQGAFWKSVEAFCAGKGNVCRAGTIQFESRPVVKSGK